MGYSKSKKSISRVKEALDTMVRSKESLTFTVENPSETAFYIRQAVRVSAEFAKDESGNAIEPYASYSVLLSKYIIRSKQNKVICELRSIPFIKEEVHPALTIPDVDDTLGIIGAVLKHRHSKMMFPDASSDTIDAEALYRFANKHSYFLIISDNHVTLTKDDPGELKYDPEKRSSV